MFFVYILFSKSKNKFYIGHTGESLEERLRRHNSNHRGYTGDVNDWKIVYAEEFKNKAEAHSGFVRLLRILIPQNTKAYV